MNQLAYPASNRREAINNIVYVNYEVGENSLLSLSVRIDALNYLDFKEVKEISRIERQVIEEGRGKITN